MPDDGNLDDLLDRALEVYGRSEPRPGLEERVLASLRQETRHAFRPALLSRLRYALAAAVLAIGAALLLRSRPAGEEATPPAPPPVPATTTAAGSPVASGVPPTPAPPATLPAPSRPVLAASRSARVPRRPAFPAPAPLGEQERLLLLYVSRTAPEELEARAGFLDTAPALPPLPDTGSKP